jgi:hypothetical protein
MSRSASFATTPAARPVAMVLAFVLSLGALPCVAADSSGGASTPAACCAHARDESNEEAATPDTAMTPDAGSTAACPGACPGTGIIADTGSPSAALQAAAAPPRSTHLTGRSLVPDLPPPRSLLIA